MKRLFDIFCSAAAIVALSPILLGVALTIYFSDFGPVLFKQRRVGRGGREFCIYKFRSMVINAERLGGYSTADGDPRITRVGKFIRRTSLDELPQLFNVFLGDMSVVGPRPDVPAQRSLYTDEEWRIRHSVRPGITGLAQATLRSAATEAQRKQMDLHYAEHASLLKDFEIIFLTFKQVFGKGGN
ncbi:sugar transferase [Pseudomonas donghuensis]|uniref:sugar transferase n=1 Tax=Pseudomonas donghuensis TaxID=1163398 RepID=UPI0020C2BCCD|nr:sugar transferase [Pseudomonas donghuensis]MBF4210500.1 sugar transferase [Pseudomonas donghuensis]MCP6700051.1 sugar transferase [Pseudomonas donghuensis]UVL22961.1 sugar transferase [Pseudomonas donghuensis]